MTLHADFARLAGNEIIKTAPPVAVVSVTLLGVGLQDWVYVITLVYLCAQLGHLAWKWIREWRRKPK